jgi:hypothetical protein
LKKWRRDGKTIVKVLCTEVEKLKELRRTALLEATYFDAAGTKVAQQFVITEDEEKNNG